jgi:prevent-host-death family protein
MAQVGVRELKNRLSRYLKRVQAGEELTVTQRGRTVARIVPAEAPTIQRALEPLLRSGHASWSGGKPRGTVKPPVIRGRTISQFIVEDRR